MRQPSLPGAKLLALCAPMRSLDEAPSVHRCSWSAAASPLVARAQSSAMPIIGFLNPQSPEAIAEPMRGLRQGLKDTGFVEGENLTIARCASFSQTGSARPVERDGSRGRGR